MNETDEIGINDRLKQVRKALDLTQAEFAKKFSIPIPTYEEYECCKRIPGPNALINLNKGGVNVNWLLTNNGNMWLSEIKQDADSDNEMPFIGIKIEVSFIHGRNNE